MTRHSAQSNQELADLLLSLGRERVVYVPNPGNAGDAFIACATFIFFDELGIDYELGSPAETYPGRTTIYAGGGNLIAEYSDAIDFIRRNHAVNRRLILLPHTVAAYKADLAEMGENVYLFCREQTSFDYCRAAVRRAHVHLGHDMVLGIPIESIREQIDSARHAGRLRSGPWWVDSSHTTLALKHVVRLGFAATHLNAFRRDAEQPNRVIPFGNVDISEIFRSGDPTPLGSLRVTAQLMSFLAPYAEVSTNRLHVCLLAALLGKKVFFEENSYFKNRAVYEHSVHGVFPHVIWVGSPALSSRTEMA